METDFIKRHYMHIEETRIAELSANKDKIDSFITFTKTLGIQLNKENFDYIHRIGLIVNYPNIVPKLIVNHNKDKEGLYSWDNLLSDYKKRYSDGFLFADNFMIMASPFFRRGMHEEANFAPRFINKFWNENIPGASAYIAIDENRVRINVDDSSYMEKDTWYGALFQKDIASIPDGLVKLRPPIGYTEDFYEIYFDSNYSLDILWSSYGNIKEFQSEEIKEHKVTLSINNRQYHPVRYLHSEFDVSTNKFRHFDGAVHLYNDEEFKKRKTSDLNFNRKLDTMIKPVSIKLFKFEGEIEVNTWVGYCSQFLTRNPLVNEYFEGEYPDYIKDLLENDTEFSI